MLDDGPDHCGSVFRPRLLAFLRGPLPVAHVLVSGKHRKLILKKAAEERADSIHPMRFAITFRCLCGVQSTGNPRTEFVRKRKTDEHFKYERKFINLLQEELSLLLQQITRESSIAAPETDCLDKDLV